MTKAMRRQTRQGERKMRAVRGSAKVNPPGMPPTYEVPLDELNKYKLRDLNREVDETKMAVTLPLAQEAEKRLLADPAYQAAVKARDTCVVEIVDAVKPTLPPGYEVVRIAPKEGTITVMNVGVAPVPAPAEPV